MIAKGTKIWTTVELFSETATRRIPPNTEGIVVGVKYDTPTGPPSAYLCKLSGFHWPKALTIDQIVERKETK